MVPEKTVGIMYFACYIILCINIGSIIPPRSTVYTHEPSRNAVRKRKRAQSRGVDGMDDESGQTGGGTRRAVYTGIHRNMRVGNVCDYAMPGYTRVYVGSTDGPRHAGNPWHVKPLRPDGSSWTAAEYERLQQETVRSTEGGSKGTLTTS